MFRTHTVVAPRDEPASFGDSWCSHALRSAAMPPPLLRAAVSLDVDVMTLSAATCRYFCSCKLPLRATAREGEREGLLECAPRGGESERFWLKHTCHGSSVICAAPDARYDLNDDVAAGA